MGKFRFAAGNPADLRSSVWTATNSRSDVYLIARNFGRFLKISLHGAGARNRVAWHEAPTNWDDPTGDRVIEKWKRPKKTEQPGWYHVLQIVVPGAYIPRARPMQSDDTRAIKWVRAPALRERLTFAVLIAPQLIQLLQLSSDQIVCGELQLLDDGAALVVAEYTKATPQDLRAWHETLAEISNLDELPLQDDGGESILQRVNVTLHPTVYDIPVSKGISFK